jgi:acetyltransferase-like isoleucine patch superfamily enzyme
MKIHPTADVQSSNIGKDTKIWQFCIILPGAKIGNNCNICAYCFIENDVVIGDNVTIKSNISIWDGAVIENNVHLGPNVVFTNDLRHRSNKKFELKKIIIREGASIGANTTILGGTEIGKYAMTGIGSVVTRDIPSYALAFGNPAKIKGWVDEEGNKLKNHGNGLWFFSDGRILNEKTGELR